MSAKTLVAGDLEASFTPGLGMIGTSLRHRGQEVLRCVDALDSAAANGSAAGIPLLHPWANRLAATGFTVAGRTVALDPASPWLHWDANGLPIHGVPWSRLGWTVLESGKDLLRACLDWDRPELLDVFPFPHRMELDVRLDPLGLQVRTNVLSTGQGSVPISFGFHPYLGIPALPREQWTIALPAMQRMELDSRSIPTGKRLPFAGMDRTLADLQLDDGFELPSEDWSMSISGAGRRVTLHALRGYRHAQVYAPRHPECVALEPMTAPTNALISGDQLRLLAAGERFDAEFRIGIE